MNQVGNESKNAAIKMLAIIGFIVVVVASVWVAVQVVRFVPTAFSSLASIADGIYGQRIDFIVATEKNIVNSGDSFAISWTNLGRPGTYVFSYRCAEGVSAEVRNLEGNIVPVDCGVKLPLAARDQTTDVIFTSEKRRFADVPFSVSFIPTGELEASEERNELVTVINAAISQSSDIAINTEDAEGDENTEEENGNDTNDETDVTGGTTQTTPVTTTIFPVSDPNGTTDLQITYLGIGTFNKPTERFTPGTEIDNDKRSAVRFEVKNIGTKTSGDWTFEADLLQSYTYNSPSQAPLRPNERAVITLGFDEITQTTGTRNIKVTVSGGNDINSNNNSFDWAVKVVD